MTQNTRSHTSNRAYTNIRTNPHIDTTYTQPLQMHKIYIQILPLLLPTIQYLQLQNS